MFAAVAVALQGAACNLWTVYRQREEEEPEPTHVGSRQRFRFNAGFERTDACNTLSRLLLASIHTETATQLGSF